MRNWVCEDIECEWALIAEPAEEVLTPDEALAQVRALSDTELGPILGFLKAARQTGEDYMGRGFMTQTWKLSCSAFSDLIWLPMAAPLQSVTSVKYYDTTGVQQTLATSIYTVDTTSRPGRIVRAPVQVWPAVQADRLANAVEITYVVGWTSADLVPERIKQGVRFMLAYQHYDREGLEERGDRAYQAALACWADQVHWKPPAYA